MPPKPKGSLPTKKTIEKRKDKVIEDKTFGLKNKKGKKTQQFVKGVQAQIKFGNQSKEKIAAMEINAKKEKEKERERDAEFQALFNPVASSSQKLSKGADPKSVLCAFFKQGLCTKGDKCKFSHDLTLEAKSEKRSMYVDVRDDSENPENPDHPAGDTMESWDEEELRRVVAKKHAEEASKPKTDIVCKHFLTAIEKGLYGWFWHCPNGGDKCMYRHALPSGFILKKDKKVMDEQKELITIEELVKREREALVRSDKTLTPVTLESFLKWKKRKVQEKQVRSDQDRSTKRKAFEQGRMLGISGREMFEFNPDTVLGDDDEAADDMAYYTRGDEEGEEGADGGSQQVLNGVEVDLTYIDFPTALQKQGVSASETNQLVIDEVLFLAESNDPLNDSILAMVKSGQFAENDDDDDEGS